MLLACGVSAAAETAISAGWSAESGIHPGLLISTSRRVAVVDRPALVVQLLAGQTTRLTHHMQRHTRLAASLDVGASAGLGALALELRGGLGAGRTFLAGETYAVDDDGEYTRVPLAGQWGWMPWTTAGLGGTIGDGGTWRWFARSGLMLQAPYHDHLAPFLINELGLTVSLGGR